MTTIGWDEVDPSHLIIIVRLFLAYMFNKGIGECINFDFNQKVDGKPFHLSIIKRGFMKIKGFRQELLREKVTPPTERIP